MYGHMYGQMGWWGWVLMILFWAAVIFGVIYLLVAVAGRGGRDGGREKTPLEILKARYARGEIDREQFEQMKKDID